MNAELRALYEADQQDRRGELSVQVAERDRVRRKRVRELLAAGLTSAEDYYHAAMIFQHGEVPEDFGHAHELALKSAEMGHRPGRWLAAAAHDRWLMRQGRPQKFGTQYRLSGNAWQLWEVDAATTDAERAEWDVPPLEVALRRAVEMTEEAPPPCPSPLEGGRRC